MRTIWKYEVPVEGRPTIVMPADAKILTVQMQHGVPTLWAMVETENLQVMRVLAVVGTGNTAPDNLGPHIGTWQQGPFVWHLFEVES